MAFDVLHALFDIQSASVGAIAFTRTAENKLKIFFSQRETISVSLTSSEDERIVKTRLACKSLGEQMAKVLPSFPVSLGSSRAIQSATIVYSPLWSTLQPIRIDIFRDMPFLVTERFLSSLASKEKEGIANEHNMRMVRMSYEHVLVNGYKLQDPVGKQANRIQGFMQVSSVHERLSSEVERTIRSALNIHDIDEYTVGELYAKSIAKIASTPSGHSGLIYVDDDITSIFFIDDACVTGQSDFPAGLHHLAKELSPNDDTHSVALSLSRLGLDGVGEPQWTGSIRAKIEKHVQDWKDSFETSLRQMKSSAVVPHTFFLIGSEGSVYISEAVKEVETASYAGNHADEISMVEIGKELCAGFIDPSSPQADPAVVFAACALNTGK
ncbi:MAG TPA: hypothetical protein PLF31_00180 [Candidatus Paceibacterota bacterium]|nr:hypothetical protein [Candidatus Paceibacterota bacterium]